MPEASATTEAGAAKPAAAVTEEASSGKPAGAGAATETTETTGAETKTDGGTEKSAAELQADADAAAAAQVAADAAVVEDAKKHGGLNKRFSKLTEAAEEARKETAEANARLKLALEALERTTGKPAAEPAKEAEPEKLVEPEFHDPEQYRRDMAEYTRKLVAQTTAASIKASQAEEAKARAEGEIRTQQQQVQKTFQERRTAAIAELPDYVEVAEAKDVMISQAMAAGIALDAMGPKIAYYLGKNPAEAERISKLAPAAQLIEMGEIRAKLKAAPVVLKTKAAEPIKPLQGGGAGAAAAKDVNELSMEEYAAQRNKSRGGGKAATH